MQKKSILIVNNNLEIGGIQKALVNLLREIHNQYDITLLLFHKHGELLKDVPISVKIIEANPLLSLLGVSFEQSKKMGYFYFLVRTGLSLFSKILGNRMPIAFLINTSRKTGTYDMAISYMQNSAYRILYGGCNEFVLKKARANQKISFVHCDFEKYEGNHTYNRNLYKKFDRIGAVSKSCQESFLKIMPDLKEKTFCIHNCYDFEQIKNLSEKDTIAYDESCFNILTVARLTMEKGIIRSLSIIKRLHEQDIHVRWHIVGDGPLYGQICEYIKNTKLEDVIFLYGKQDNPYRFIKNADLLFVPSYHEAAPMVFNESACLGVPVFSTKTCSAMELVEKGGIGWVSENNEDSIFETLKNLLIHPEKISEIKEQMTMPNNNKEALCEFNFSIL